MRRSLPFALSLLVAAAACGPAEVVVSIEVEMPNPDGEGMITQALSDVEVQLIPFDRDELFDQMATAYGVPEPEIPQELLDRRAEVQEAQAEWDAANRRWATIRDTLQKLNDAMEPLAAGFDGDVDLGQLTFGCALGYLDFRFPELHWREGRPALDRWYEGFVDRPSLQATMPRDPA